MAKKRRKFTTCPNCSYTFAEVNNYCPNCGQENHDLNVPAKHLIEEFFESTLHYDTKFWRTLKYLLIRPGLLTEKFNMGQRATYVPPFRLYIFVSIVFFTTIALFATDSLVKPSPDLILSQREEAIPKAVAHIRMADSLASTSGSHVAVQAMPRRFISVQAIPAELKAKVKGFASNPEQARQKLLKNISFMMFALMPFFGFILYLFYSSQGRNYVEHMMFSVHFHTFVFILIMLAVAVELIFSSVETNGWVILISMVYLYFALRYVYKESYLRTAVKLVPISITYFVSLMALFIATVGISVLLS